MQRLAPALVALLALVALATAAGSLASVDGDLSVTSGTAPTPGEPRQHTGGGGAPDPPNGTESSGAVDGSPTETPADSGDRGGVSPLVVAGVVAALLTVGLLVVVLTGDDTRAPPGEEGAGGEEGPPALGVDPSYERPADSAVVRAWRRFADRARPRDAATPTETAAAAADRGFPGDAARELATQFEAVRYGRRPVTEDRERRAERAADRLDDTPAADAVARDGESDPAEARERNERGDRA